MNEEFIPNRSGITQPVTVAIQSVFPQAEVNTAPKRTSLFESKEDDGERGLGELKLNITTGMIDVTAAILCASADIKHTITVDVFGVK